MRFETHAHRHTHTHVHVDVMMMINACARRHDDDDKRVFFGGCTGRSTVMLQEVSGEAFQFSEDDSKPVKTQGTKDGGPARRAVPVRCCNLGMIV